MMKTNTLDDLRAVLQHARLINPFNVQTELRYSIPQFLVDYS